MRIIDIHSHIGNLLYKEGGKLIEAIGIEDRSLFDTGFKLRNLMDAGFYAALLDYQHNEKEPNKLVRAWATYSGRQRNFAASLENMQKSIDASGVSHTCCLPIPPYVTFDDVSRAQKKDRRIIPFTGVDFTRQYDINKTLRLNVESGAKGMKLHPIIQNIALTDDRTKNAVEAFAVHNLPILFHSGVTTYYHGEEKKKENPRNGAIDGARELLMDFPSVLFIVGHAGLIQVREVIDKLSKLDNAYVDTSFQSPKVVRELINSFGSERVLFASDWPYGDRKTSIRIVKRACAGNNELEHKIFYENAANLMRLTLI